ncbi:MAG: alpha-E domain-containing protein, partial [Sphingomonadaceae bacterium]
DVCIVASRPVDAVTLVPPKVAIRRNPGTLPSRAADNLFWLGRYLERGEGTLRQVRAALGGTIEADGGGGLLPGTMARLRGLLVASGAAAGGGDETLAADVRTLAQAALDGDGPASVRRLLGNVHAIGEGTRDRLSADVWRLIDAPVPQGQGDEDAAALLDRATGLQVRFSALAGLAAENMGRTSAWRFHDVGRRIERAVLTCRLLRNFADDDASADDLTTLLDLTDSQITYRARYMTELSLAPVRDLVALDGYNPRSLAYQVASIGKHLAALPVLRDDGMAEEQQLIAIELGGLVALAKAEALGANAVMGIENRLLALSDAIGRRYFLQGSEALRASSMVLA